MRLGDDQWEQLDRNTWRLSVKNLQETDRFQILGPGNVPMHLDLETTYTRAAGMPTVISPQTSDPLSPFNWAGVLWQGSATSTFTARSDDGSWSVTGTMDFANSAEGVGHIVDERNGVFVSGDD